MAFAENLKLLRKELDISQEEFADMLDVSRKGRNRSHSESNHRW